MASIGHLPSAGLPDSTPAVLREGYKFIGNRCDRLHSDAFVTRLLLSKAVCMRGADAAEAFYGGGRFGRQGAMPPSVLKLLQDRGSVQLLEGEAHRHRKQLFMTALSREGVEGLAAQFAKEWRARLPVWERASRIVLIDQVRHVLFRAVCAWAGMPLRSEAEAIARVKEITAMIEATGSVGPRNWRAMWLRRRSERWARDILLRMRHGILPADPARPAAHVARYRGLDGRFLPPEVAAVEMLNLIRPTVAASHFIVFAALALHEHPEWRRAFESGNEADLENFVQEVRRISPFFPFIGGKVRIPFRWRDIDFTRGQWVLLDLYGTCRDRRHWREPEAFRPERFRDDDHGFAFVPQGGGDYLAGHRCPGEGATIALTMEAVRLLARAMRYDVPEQDLSVDLARIPTLPKSGFVLENVRAAG
jgi:fatty-acid peroxygenase